LERVTTRGEEWGIIGFEREKATYELFISALFLMTLATNYKHALVNNKLSSLLEKCLVG